ADRAEKRDEVLNTAAEHGADQDPERPGQIAELRGERRTDQRSRSRDGREVMSENDPAVRRHEVAAVAEPLRGSRASRLERENFRREECAIETIADGVDANGGDDEPERVDALAAHRSDDTQRDRAERDD